MLETMTAAAERLIAQYGMSATLTRVTEGTYDPATGKPALTETTETMKVVLAGESKHRRDMADSANVTGYCAGVMRPQPNDRVTTIDGTDWIITTVRPITVEGGDVLYSLSMRIA